jgi:hypothetical protein
LASNLKQNKVFNIANWSFFGGVKIGQFGLNLAKSGQKLEKVSQPRGLRFHSNKYDFLKLE